MTIMKLNIVLNQNYKCKTQRKSINENNEN